MFTTEITRWFRNYEKCLEPISEIPKKNDNTTEVKKAKEIFIFAFKSGYEPAEVLRPRKYAPYFPPTLISYKGPAILSSIVLIDPM